MILLILSFVILGAHFLRSGNWLVMVICVLAPLLLIVRKRWSLLVVQLFAYVGAGIWINTALVLSRKRIIAGAPWGRLVLIMGLVALFTALSGYLLNAPGVKEKYPSKEDQKR
jgi:hypothetical protein